MKRNEDFRNALGEPDEYFQQSVMDTLNQLNRQAERESRPKWSFSMRLVSSFAALVLVIGGIVIAARNDHHDYLMPVATGPVDITATTQSTNAPLAIPPVIDAEQAVLTFTEAVKDGSDVRITVDIQPKHEHTLALNTNHLMSTSVQYVSDLYGIQPDSPEQTLYEWAVEHGFQEVLAVDLNTPREDIPGFFTGSWHIEKHTLREDGSAVMTIVGPAAENDIYELNYNIIPLNMEDNGESFLPGSHDGGLFRLTLTDTASHIPELEVFPGTSTSDIPPITEYSRKAWGLTDALSYKDLVNKIDVRIGQVYYVKGVVQEVLSASPLRVLINTSEDGTSRPVIIESPSYCTFPWKAGSSYRIYADASCLYDNIPVLTARYCYIDALEYEQENTQENEQEDIEFDQGTVKIREAVTDGIAVYLSVEVQPKDSDCLTLADYILPSYSTPENIGKTSDYDGQTVYQWAVEHGYQKLLQFKVTSLPDGLFNSFRTTEAEITETGSTLINLVSSTVPDTDQYPLHLSLTPYDMDFFAESDEPSSSLIAAECEEKDISLSVRATGEVPVTLADYISIADPDTGKSEGKITVSIIRTSLNTYCKQNRLEDDKSFVCYCILYPIDNEMAGSFANINHYYDCLADNRNCIMIPEKEITDDVLENLPETLKYYLATYPENAIELSQAWYTLKKLGEAHPLLPAEEMIDAFTDPNHTVTP